jgi:hypothetical protein
MSIQGEHRKRLTKEAILEKISQFDIYKMYFGNFELNKVTRNKFRGEGDPSFIIGTKFGEITHKDFSDDKWKGNCFSLVQQIYNCNYFDALRIIDKDFSLGISSEITKDYKKIISEYVQPIISEISPPLIQVITRKFKQEELDYWNKYNLDIEDLKKNNVYSISKLYLNRQLFSLKETELRFGYKYGEYWKIYRPFEVSKLKWMPNNVPLTTLDSKEAIIDCTTAWITKSRKDRMVLSKLYPNVLSTQNESIACFSEENLKFIKDNSKKQVIFYDSDPAGVKASKQITKEFDMDYCNIPRSYLSDGVVDPADLVKEYGINKLEQILIKKKLL